MQETIQKSEYDTKIGYDNVEWIYLAEDSAQQ
jgi:hypothetical protein